MGDRLHRHPIYVDGEVVFLVRPNGPFTVDGITYQVADRESSVACIRPIIMALPDDEDPDFDDADDHLSTMFHSDPPTEEELDLFVKHRVLPPI